MREHKFLIILLLSDFTFFYPRTNIVHIYSHFYPFEVRVCVWINRCYGSGSMCLLYSLSHDLEYVVMHVDLTFACTVAKANKKLYNTHTHQIR